MTSDELNMVTAIDNVISEFKTYGKIENAIHIQFLIESYRHVTGTMMRNYAREVGGQAFVDEIDRVLAKEKSREMR